MYKQRIEQELLKAVKSLGFIKPIDTVLSIPEKSQFGDYSSNIALQLSKQKHKEGYQNPREIANAIIQKLGHPVFLERVEVAGAGFINFFLKDEALVREIWSSSAEASADKEIGEIREIGDEEKEQKTKNQKRIIVEYCDLNTHKMVHIGHLLPLTLGETLARLLEYQGHEVFRTNYGSDIGLTVAKCIWGIEKHRQEFVETRSKTLREKVIFLGKIYAFAHSEYEKSLETKEEIDEITNKIYQRDPEVVPLWDETKEWSLGYFETIYSIFGTLFDRRINESEVDQIGKQIVLENLGKVFTKDDGAIIFPGQKHGLHNRVFVNFKGNPTYEGKEVGLASKYQEIFQANEIRIFSDKAQDDYFKVTIAANEMVFPHMKGKFKHYSYGSIGLTTGKMSSRSGNVVIAEDLIDAVKQKVREISPELDELSIIKLAIGAVKFAFLKYSPKSDIIYDVEESVSIHGDTGPYVLYVYARINSLLKKSQMSQRSQKEPNEPEESKVEKNESTHDLTVGVSSLDRTSSDSGKPTTLQSGFYRDKEHLSRLTQAKGLGSSDSLALEPEEREVLRQLEYFEFIATKAAENFQPNELVKYLLNLTKAFNLFYEKLPVIGSRQEEFRLLLSKRVAENIKLGLYLLGIETVDRM